MNQYMGVFPEALVAFAGLALLVLPVLRSPKLLGWIAFLVLAAAFLVKGAVLFCPPAAEPLFSGAKPLFGGMLAQDRFARLIQLLILGAMGLVVLSFLGYVRAGLKHHRELYALLLLATVGLLLLAGAQHLALIYVGLELISLFSYLLTGFLKKESLSAEAGLKYFLFGSLATGAFIYGITLLYGMTGALDLPTVAAQFPEAMGRAPLLGAICLTLLLVGLGFKLALVPFHMWAPDAYEGAPTPIAAFISVGPKLAGFALLARIFLVSVSPQVTFWPWALGILALLTMTVGNLVALAQSNVKRLLAYSSIAHAGTMAIGLAVASPLGLTALLYYLAAYGLMNLAAFAGVVAVGNAAGREDLGAFSGLSQREPFLALMITIAFLSLAGIPPMAGFFAKMWIFAAALKAGAVWLAVAAALNSVVALFYYVKVIKTMYLDPVPAGAAPIPASGSLRLALVLCAAGLLIAGFLPGPWLTLAGSSLPVPAGPDDLPWISLQGNGS